MRALFQCLKGNAFPKYEVPYKLIYILPQSRFISTSKNTSETISAETRVAESKTMETVVSKRKRNWQTYGFDYVNEVDDLTKAHGLFFSSISLLLCSLIFLMTYYPDINQQDWVKREGFLELHRRESLGLPLVDPNYVDPKSVILPSDEELGETDIII